MPRRGGSDVRLTLSPLRGLAGPAPGGELTLLPRDVTLRGKAARQRLIVTGTVAGRTVDLTRTARFQSESPGIVAVSADGIITPVGDGSGVIVASVEGR